jgi:hypothetical protein
MHIVPNQDEDKVRGRLEISHKPEMGRDRTYINGMPFKWIVESLEARGEIRLPPGENKKIVRYNSKRT